MFPRLFENLDSVKLRNVERGACLRLNAQNCGVCRAAPPQGRGQRAVPSLLLGKGQKSVKTFGHFNNSAAKSRKSSAISKISIPPFQLFTARNLTNHPRTLINDENH
jgi:hypothetical protein